MPALLLTILLLTVSAPAQDHAPGGDPGSTYLLLLNKADASVSIIDPITRSESRRIAIGATPQDLAVSPDGRTAAVRSQQAGDALTLVNIAAGKRVGHFELYESSEPQGQAPARHTTQPEGMCFLPCGRKILLPDAAKQQLLVFDIEKQAVERSLPTGNQRPAAVAVSRHGDAAFATNPLSQTLQVIDLASTRPKPTRDIPTGIGTQGLVACPAGDLIWLIQRTNSAIQVLDTSDHLRSSTIETPDTPTRLAFSNDGSLALISCSEAGTVLIFDAPQRTLRQRVAISGDNSEVSCLPVALCVDPDSRFAWISCTRGEFLAVLDLASLEVVDRVATRPGPGSIAFAQIR